MNFEKRQSPLDSMGIGQKQLIRNWLDEMGVEGYTIRDDLLIDVKKHVDLEYKDLKEFPGFIQFDRVYGYFTCNGNDLTSLRGCPKYVKGSFYCDYNKLKTLDHCPQRVEISFWCQGNKIQFSEEYVKKLCDVHVAVLV